MNAQDTQKFIEIASGVAEVIKLNKKMKSKLIEKSRQTNY